MCVYIYIYIYISVANCYVGHLLQRKTRKLRSVLKYCHNSAGTEGIILCFQRENPTPYCSKTLLGEHNNNDNAMVQLSIEAETDINNNKNKKIKLRKPQDVSLFTNSESFMFSPHFRYSLTNVIPKQNKNR